MTETLSARAWLKPGHARSFLLSLLFAGIPAVVFLVLGGAVLAQKPGSPHPDSADGVSFTIWASNLGGPRGLLVDRANGIWVADQSAGRVVKVDQGGQVTTLAENLLSPHDLAMDASGNIYVAETPSGKVLLISPSGMISTYADGLLGPVDLAFNQAGELVVCEYIGGQVVALRSRAQKRVVVSGFRPHGLAFDMTGTTYVNDVSGSRVVRVTMDGKIEQLVGGINVPIGLAFGPSGDLYVAEKTGGRLLRIKPSGKTQIILRGLTTPRDPVFDGSGNLYVAETDLGRILKVTGEF